MANTIKSPKTSYEAALAGDLKAFFTLGGLRAIENKAAYKAADKAATEAAAKAVRDTRLKWLPLLEAWYETYPDKPERLRLAAAIKTLRKQLGRRQRRTRQSLVERRAKTAERVRRHRAARSIR